jgi:hypothetical protein
MQSKLRLFGNIILGLILIILGYFVAFHIGKPLLDNGKASESWPSVSGKIISSEVVSSQDRNSEGNYIKKYSAKIVYAYKVGSQEHESSQVSFGGASSSTNSHSAYQMQGEYPKGKTIHVFYNPKTPEIAILKSGVHLSSYIVYGAGLLFFGIGFLVPLSSLKSLFNKIPPKLPIDPVDPENINDPIAHKTSWDPLVTGGANYRTRWLKQSTSTQFEFVPTKTSVCFYWGFLVLGFVFTGIFLHAGRNALFFLFGGLVFIFIGTMIRYIMNTPIVFDSTSGFFWKGRKKPDPYGEDLQNLSIDSLTKLDQIYALQLISELVVQERTRDSTSKNPIIFGGRRRTYMNKFCSYELNLVLKDGNRINVLDHGDIVSLREEAKILSDHLSVLLWDTTQANENKMRNH